MPPLLSFFVQFFVNRKVNVKLNLEERNVLSDILPFILEGQLNRIIARVSEIASRYKLWTPFTDIHEDAQQAERIMSLATQFGEGW